MKVHAVPIRRFGRLLGASTLAAVVAAAGVTYAVVGGVLVAEPSVATVWRASGVLCFAAAFLLLRFGWRRSLELVRGRLPLDVPPLIVAAVVLLLFVTFPWSLFVVALYLPMLVAAVALLLIAIAAAARYGMRATRSALLAAGALSVATGVLYDRSYAGLVCEDVVCVVKDRRALIAGILIGISLWALRWLLPTLAQRVGEIQRDR